MGSRIGAEKTAAARIGVSVDDYRDRLGAGQKWCHGCHAWKSREDFVSDRSRGDGRAATCSSCRNDRILPGPSIRERRRQRANGLAWCAQCATWLPVASVRGGKCRQHHAAYARHRFATDADYRYRRRSRASRRRHVAAVPPSGEELIAEHFGGRCAYCAKPADTYDHIVPVSRGGVTDIYNIVPACRSCNSKKKDKDPDEWLASIDPDRAAAVIELQVLEHMPLWHHRTSP
jgi:5-methylcytosine-specific restriction endonuclease McrA